MTPAPSLYGKGHQPREPGTASHRDLLGGDLCLDFINTVDDHDQSGRHDSFAPGYVNLVSWFEHAGSVTGDEARRLLQSSANEPREAAAVRKRAIGLRTALFTIVSAVTQGHDADAESIAHLNEECRHAFDSGRYVQDGDKLGWRWNEGDHLDRMLWEVTRSAVDLFSNPRMAKVRQCAAPDCQRFFLDTSKNGSRRFCSAATCGTAERVRRFRARQRPES